MSDFNIECVLLLDNISLDKFFLKKYFVGHKNHLDEVTSVASQITKIE